MRIKILDKYIISELVGPFIFGVATFTLLFMSVDLFFKIASLIVQKNLSLTEGMLCIIYNLPYILVFTFPMSVLLATLMAFGRLSGESEIIAMKASGISLYRIALPAIVFAALVTFASGFINEKLSPEYTYRAKNILIKKLSKEGAKIWENISIKEKTPDGLERIITARKFNYKDGLMEGVMIQDYKDTKPVRWVRADSAVWEEDKWFLINGDVYNLSVESSGDIKYQTHFDRYVSRIPYSPKEIEMRERSPEEMDSGQIKEKIHFLEKTYSPTRTSPYDRVLDGQINNLYVALYQKAALPFTCFVFALIGIPLGIRPHRTSTSIGLGLSIVFIFIYYILMSIGRALGENSILPPAIASWLPIAIFAAAGLYLLYKKGQG
ncbi:MAG: LptF/LptG family permease [Armatimonadota bacterium]